MVIARLYRSVTECEQSSQLRVDVSGVCSCWFSPVVSLFKVRFHPPQLALTFSQLSVVVMTTAAHTAHQPIAAAGCELVTVNLAWFNQTSTVSWISLPCDVSAADCSLQHKVRFVRRGCVTTGRLGCIRLSLQSTSFIRCEI